MIGGEVEMVGFPNFWQQAYDLRPAAFDAIHDIDAVQIPLRKKPVKSPLEAVIRHMAKINCNSLSALVTLLMDGHGSDGMKIARSMWETAVTADYLKRTPAEIDDYLDFYHIFRKTYIDAIPRDQLPKDYTPEKLAEIEAEYNRVSPRFIQKGRIRTSWSRISVYKMAEVVGRKDQYTPFYAWASGMHHVNAVGLQAQTEDDGVDVDTAPSTRWILTALAVGQDAVLSVIDDYNEAAGHGMEKEIAALRDHLKKVWEVDRSC